MDRRRISLEIVWIKIWVSVAHKHTKAVIHRARSERYSIVHFDFTYFSLSLSLSLDRFSYSLLFTLSVMCYNPNVFLSMFFTLIWKQTYICFQETLEVYFFIDHPIDPYVSKIFDYAFWKNCNISIIWQEFWNFMLIDWI